MQEALWGLACLHSLKANSELTKVLCWPLAGLLCHMAFKRVHTIKLRWTGCWVSVCQVPAHTVGSHRLAELLSLLLPWSELRPFLP